MNKLVKVLGLTLKYLSKIGTNIGAMYYLDICQQFDLIEMQNFGLGLIVVSWKQ